MTSYPEMDFSVYKLIVRVPNHAFNKFLKGDNDLEYNFRSRIKYI